MSRLAGSIILLSGWRRTLVAFVAGAIAVLGQAPFDFPAACFVAFPLLVWLLDGSAAGAQPGLRGIIKPSFATGYWFGFGYFLAGLWWIGGAVLVESDEFAWALPFAVLGIPLVLAVFYGLAASVARLFWSDGVGRIAALAFGFGIAEWLRSFVLTGFPWNAIGYAAMPVPLLMQSVEVVGLLGMNAIAVFVFASPALLGTGRGARAGMALAALLAALHVGYGYVRLQQQPLDATKQIAVRLVQPDVDLSEKWDASVRDRIFKSMLDLSSKPPETGAQPPALIVWPETSVPFILSENPSALTAIGETLKDGQVLVAGAVREEGIGAGGARYYNSVVQIDTAGEIVDAVDKVHLVPFGEYLPFADLFAKVGLTQLVAGPMNFAPGSQRHPLAITPTVQVMPYVCYEVIFPNLMPPDSTAADILLNVTNDAWFGATPGPYQHLRQAQIRAVEVRKPLIRAANTGISAIVLPTGRIEKGLALNTQGTIDAVVAVSQPWPWRGWIRSLYNGWIVLGLFLVLALGGRLLRLKYI